MDEQTLPLEDEPSFQVHADIVPPSATAQQKGAFILNGHIRFYTKAKVKEAVSTWTGIVLPAREAMKEAWPLEGPLSIKVELGYPFPKSTPKKVVAKGVAAKSTKPDVDNVLKALIDTMTRLQVWRDDSQIAELHAKKVLCDRAFVSIEVRHLS